MSLKSKLRRLWKEERARRLAYHNTIGPVLENQQPIQRRWDEREDDDKSWRVVIKL